MVKAITEAGRRRRRNINNTIEELHSLSDSDLNDIGIVRANIEVVARGLIYIHRVVRDNSNGKVIK
jgi:uncharacterized protein YjiS (DUF1127 family)